MNKYKPGDKFVIEIEDVYEQGNPTLYRIKGFNSLVFDARGLDKVPQLVDGIHPRSYDKGMKDAWDTLTEVIEIYAETRKGPCGTYADVIDKHSRNKLISIMGRGPQRVREALTEWKCKPPTLTEREKHFVECLEDGWLTKGEACNEFKWWEKKPRHERNKWVAYEATQVHSILSYAFGIKLPFITWEDEEPWSVEELRKLEVQE